MQNYFELFSLKPEFLINLTTLEHDYQVQISKFHPDKFVTQNAEKRLTALRNTSLINVAFNTLKSPLLRATYLLELQGVNAFDEKDTQMEVNFLMSQIELRESLEAIQTSKDETALYDFIDKIKISEKQYINNISQMFEQGKLEKIKNLVREFKFNQQLKKESNNLIDELL